MDFSLIINDRKENYEKSYLVPNFLEQFYKNDKIPFCAYPLLYAAGMIGYAACLPFRILRVLKEALMLIVDAVFYIAKKDEENFKKRIFINGCAWLQIAFGIIGILCPLIAYKGDKYVQSFNVYNATNFPPYHEKGTIFLDEEISQIPTQP